MSNQPKDQPGQMARNVVRLNGIEVILYTHRQDLLFGARCRGEKEMSPQEMGELAFLQAAIQPGDHVLDAGAYIGAYSIVLAKQEPSATIYSFEPDPLNFSLLNINLSENEVSNVCTFNYALGRDTGFVDLYLNPSNFMDHRTSALRGDHFGESSFRKMRTRVPRVNPADILRQTMGADAPPYFHLLKIDAQGADFEILEACLPLLTSESTVSIEYSPYHLAGNGTDSEEVVSLIEKFRHVGHVSLAGDGPKITSLQSTELLLFYESSWDHYQGYWDLVLTGFKGTIVDNSGAVA